MPHTDQPAGQPQDDAKPNPESLPDGSGPGSDDGDTTSGGSPDEPDH